jgi:hypothetical protein
MKHPANSKTMMHEFKTVWGNWGQRKKDIKRQCNKLMIINMRTFVIAFVGIMSVPG